MESFEDGTNCEQCDFTKIDKVESGNLQVSQIHNDKQKLADKTKFWVQSLQKLLKACLISTIVHIVQLNIYSLDLTAKISRSNS